MQYTLLPLTWVSTWDRESDGILSFDLRNGEVAQNLDWWRLYQAQTYHNPALQFAYIQGRDGSATANLIPTRLLVLPYVEPKSHAFTNLDSSIVLLDSGGKYANTCSKFNDVYWKCPFDSLEAGA